VTVCFCRSLRRIKFQRRRFLRKGRTGPGLHDINPHAPGTLLVIQKTIAPLADPDRRQIAHYRAYGSLPASDCRGNWGCEEGFRTVFNAIAMGGRRVYHIHLHCNSGSVKMRWPPG